MNPKKKISVLFYRTRYEKPDAGSSKKPAPKKSKKGLKLTIKGGKRSYEEAIEGKDDYRQASIRSKDGGLHGDRKPFFVRQPSGKANPPLPEQLAVAARYRYDQAQVEFFPPARFEDAKRLNIPRRDLRLPKMKFTNPFLKGQKKEFTLNPSSIWGTRTELSQLFENRQKFEDARKRGASLNFFKDETEVRIFMDLAMDVLPTPSPVRPGHVSAASEFALAAPLNHLTDAYEMPEKIEGNYVEGVLAKYEKAVARAAYVATQQLHMLQLRMLEALRNELVKDANEGKSVSALLEPPAPPVQEIVDVASDTEVPLEADDL